MVQFLYDSVECLKLWVISNSFKAKELVKKGEIVS